MDLNQMRRRDFLQAILAANCVAALPWPFRAANASVSEFTAVLFEDEIFDLYETLSLTTTRKIIFRRCEFVLHFPVAIGRPAISVAGGCSVHFDGGCFRGAEGHKP